MAYKHYTRCYQYTPGDIPFNEGTMIPFILAVTWPWLLGVIASFAAGSFVLGGAFLGIAYGVALVAVANEWLNHRLVCISDEPTCAIGRIANPPMVDVLGEFDNDEFFDVWLMPHPFCLFDRWVTEKKERERRASEEGRDQPDFVHATEFDGDGFQGEMLLKKSISDLDFIGRDPPTLHCEAEGDFWVKMRAWAPAAAALMAAATGAAAWGGAILGPVICAALGPVTLGLSTLLCPLIILLVSLAFVALAGVAVHYAVSAAAFYPNPGDVEDAHVGDRPLGPLIKGNKVVVYGEHVYDGFHKGWHEFHPLMAIMRVGDDDGDYIEQDCPPPSDPGLTDSDLMLDPGSDELRAQAASIRTRWCGMLDEAFDEGAIGARRDGLHRWTIHPRVDGCEHISPPADLI